MYSIIFDYSDVTKQMEWLQILSCFNQFLHLCLSADFSECLWRDKHSVSRHSGKHVITVLQRIKLVEEYNVKRK